VLIFHCGSLDIDSAPGSGTCVTLTVAWQSRRGCGGRRGCARIRTVQGHHDTSMLPPRRAQRLRAGRGAHG